MSSPLVVNCPTCAEPVAWQEENTHRPFCSDRCRKIDLGAWASEEYAIPAQSQDEWELQDSLDSSTDRVQ